ncbi:MAG: NADAR family protein [Candidatus Thiodiazotropha sp.]
MIKAGWSPKYLSFWGHRAKSGSTIGKHVLSQWWNCRFEVDGIVYLSAEHYMMAEKARLFDDVDAQRRILQAASPGAAKALGRGIRNFDEAVWEAARFDIVVRGNIEKFGQNEVMHDYLLTTGEKVLVEASPVDRIWGIGLASDDPRAEDPAQWQGENLLGFALMQTRKILCDC